MINTDDENFRKTVALIAIKAAQKSHIFDINQLLYYKVLNLESFPFTNAEVYYTLYFYKYVNNTLNSAGSLWNLVSNLREVEKTCVIIPINLMIEILQSQKKYDYAEWASGERQEYIRLSTRICDIIRIASRNSIIDSFKLLLDKDITNSYKVSRFLTNKVKILNGYVNPFPIITITDKRSLKKYINRSN